MEQFAELKDIYQHLEKEAANYKYHTEITDLFRYAGELKVKENKIEELNNFQWEIDFFNFVIRDNKLSGMISRVNENGDLIEIPSLNDFTEDKYKYLIQRQKDVLNPFMIAKYSHLLWLSPKRHINYATQTIDAYLDLVKIYEEKDRINSEKISRPGLNVLSSIKNAYYIATSVKEKLDVVKSEIIRLVKNFNFESSAAYVMRGHLIEIMLDNKKLFTKQDFTGIDKLCEELAIKNPDISIDILEIGERVDIKLGNKNEKWKRRIAEVYEGMSIAREDGINIVAIDFCQKAIDIYKKIKDKTKVEELEKHYKHLKDTMELGIVSHDFDISDLMKEFRRVANDLSEKTSEEILMHLMFDPNLLPQYEELEKQVAIHKEVGFTKFLAKNVIYDRAGNVAQHFSDAEELEYLAFLQSYDFTLKLSKDHLIREIFVAAIKKEKLTIQHIIAFFQKHSWFGKNIEKADGKVYNWLVSIVPSLIEYFRQMEISFSVANYYPNLILPIDSLTLKIEGLLRDLCEFQGITTFYSAKDKKDRTITREKDINALLYEESLMKLLEKDDLLFLRFLLIEKAGYNLRNNIAHSLMGPNSYSLEYMHLLILAVIKLGKYDFKPSDPV